MRLLADAYMLKGNIHQGEEEAVKVSFILFVTQYWNFVHVDLWHLLKKYDIFGQTIPLVIL